MVGCVDENRVIALLDGDLPVDSASEVHDHVSNCNTCRMLLAEMAKAHTVVAADEVQTKFIGLPGERRLSSAQQEADELSCETTQKVLSEVLSIGRYRILRKLGEGGMGEVFVAEDPDLHRRVAIKLLHAGTPDAADRLLREARAMAKLRHPNTIAVYEVGRSGHNVFVAMEFNKGITLRKWLKEDHDLPARLGMLIQAGRGLAAAHDVGLVHRDFKPDNVMVELDRRAQVLDFGLAKSASTAAHEEEVGSIDDIPVVDLTLSGVMVGTPAYLAPEQFRMSATDERTDQFSFCVVLFEALHGKRPYAGESLWELAEAVTQGIQSEWLTNPEIPTDVKNAIMRGLSVKPKDRFPDMQSLIDVLTAHSTEHAELSGESGHSSQARVETIEPARAPLSLRSALVAATLVIAAIVTTVAVLSEDPAKEEETLPVQSAEVVVETLAQTEDSDATVAEKEEPKVPVVEKVSLTVHSKPTGASIIRDGIKVGETPLSLDVDKMSEPLLFTLRKRGFRDKKFSMSRERASTRTVKLERKKASKPKPRKPKPRKPKPRKPKTTPIIY
jgi:serine/threonine protein kinase